MRPVLSVFFFFFFFSFLYNVHSSNAIQIPRQPTSPTHTVSYWTDLLTMIASLQLLVLLWACCIANIIPSANQSPKALNIDSRPSSAPLTSDYDSISSLDAAPPATSDTASPHALDDVDICWYAQCKDGLLAKCVTEGNTFCTNNQLNTDLDDCTLNCACVAIPTLDLCFNNGTSYHCWGSLFPGIVATDIKESTGNEANALGDDDAPAPSIGEALGCAASPFSTVVSSKLYPVILSSLSCVGLTSIPSAGRMRPRRRGPRL